MPVDILNQICGMIQGTKAVPKPTIQRLPPTHVDSVARKQHITPTPPADDDTPPQGLPVHYSLNYQLRSTRF
jgi:hypothetical protein